MLSQSHAASPPELKMQEEGTKLELFWSSGHLYLLGQAGDLPKAQLEWQQH